MIDLVLRDYGYELYEGEYPAPEDLYQVEEAQWELYRTITNKLVDLEDEIASHKIEASEALPDDLQALVGILSDAEINAILALRKNVETPTAEPEEDLPVQVITKAPVPPCTRQGAKAGAHTPGRYFLKEDGSVSTQCPCGMVFDNVKCPHRTQMKQGKNIVCAWCRAIIIANTGAPSTPVGADNLDSLRVVNVDQWKGTAE